jgi:hypothetical protein
MKVSTYLMEGDAQIEAATDLVTGEIRKKKAADAVLQQAIEIDNDIDVPAEHLLKKSTIEAS